MSKKNFLRRRLDNAVSKKIMHRVMVGVKDMDKKALAAFILQNLAEGWARGLVKEMKENG